MERIVGLDTSLTATGIGVITRRTNGTCVASCTTITSRGKRDDGLPERARRIERLADDILHSAASAVLVVIESPTHGTKGGSIMDRNYLWWRVVSGLVARSVPVAVCAATTRSKFATGNGRSDKAAVAVAAARLWADLEINNSDEGDAIILSHIGAVFAGWAVPTLERHRDSLPAIRWPDLPEGPAAHPTAQEIGA